jgi:septum formation protein
LNRRPALVLASASPRRYELLGRLGIPFVVAPSHIREDHPVGPPETAVVAVALAKARAVARALPGPSDPWPDLPVPPVAILGADTEVVLDGQLLGKPRDAAHAAGMLRLLRGRTHEVVTGVALVVVPAASAGDGPSAAGWCEETASAVTRVTMARSSDAEIEDYVATGEGLDKAGGYAVQGLGGRLVQHVDGCLTNVIGLPLETTRRILQRASIL